jgi:hypothetical protein
MRPCLPLSDTAESQGLTLRDLLSFPEPAANPRLLVMIPMVPPQSADVIPAGDQPPSTFHLQSNCHHIHLKQASRWRKCRAEMWSQR